MPSVTITNVPLILAGQGTDKGVKTDERNPLINKWYDEENKRREQLSSANKYILGVAVAQYLLYLAGFIDNVGQRDDEIKEMTRFIEYLQSRKHGADLTMARCVSEVIDVPLPEVDMCGDPLLLAPCVWADGAAVDALSLDLSKRSCGGVPDNWALHEGNLMQARSAVNVGGLVANAQKREREWFRNRKTDLVRAGQSNMKAPFRSSEILAMRSQAMNIYSGLASLFAQGVNSAGATIGTIMGRNNGFDNNAGGTN